MMQYIFRAADGTVRFEVTTDLQGVITYAPSQIARFIGKHIEELRRRLESEPLINDDKPKI